LKDESGTILAFEKSFKNLSLFNILGAGHMVSVTLLYSTTNDS